MTVAEITPAKLAIYLTMKMLIVASSVLTFCCGTFLRAEDALVNGGTSPDGRYEIRIFETSGRDPSNYFYGVVDTKSGKLIKQLDEGGGYAVYEGAKETGKVLWHPSSRFFALTDHGSRHSMDLYIYEISRSQVTLIQTPNYFQNALGRVGSTEGYLIEIVTPISWDKDFLTCTMDFDAYLPNNQGRSPTYTTRFKLELLHGPNQASELLLKGMTDPKANE